MRLSFLGCLFCFFVSIATAQPNVYRESSYRDEGYSYSDTGYQNNYYNGYRDNGYDACCYAECCYPCSICMTPQPCCGYVCGDVSLLYWQSNLGGLGFAFETRSNDDYEGWEPERVEKENEIVRADCEWNFGVRASIGFGCCDPCDPCSCCWSFILVGTYLPSNSTTIRSLPTEKYDHLSPLYHHKGFLAERIEAKYDLDFATFDLLGRVAFCTCGCLEILPSFGLRAAWIDQNFNLTNERLKVYAESDTTYELYWPDSSTHFRSCYRAVGLRGGVDFSFPLFCWMRLTGGLGGSLLYGDVHIKENINCVDLEYDSNWEPYLVDTHIKNRDTVCKLSSNWEAEVGLVWECCLHCLRLHLGVSYFFSIWFDQNNFKNFDCPPTSRKKKHSDEVEFAQRCGNLQLHGLVLTGGFCF